MKPLRHRLLSLSLLGALALAATATVTGCVARSGDETTDTNAKPLDGVAPDPDDPNGSAPFSGVGLEEDPSTAPPKASPEQKQALPGPIPWHEDDVLPAPIPWVTSAPAAK